MAQCPGRLGGSRRREGRSLGVRALTAMLCQQWGCRWAQPCTLLLLLLGPQLVVTYGWQPQGEGNGQDQATLELYFPATVEYAVHVFNQRSQDRNAYKVVRILRSWKEPVGTTSSPLPHWPTPAVNEGREGGCHRGISITI